MSEIDLSLIYSPGDDVVAGTCRILNNGSDDNEEEHELIMIMKLLLLMMIL